MTGTTFQDWKQASAEDRDALRADLIHKYGPLIKLVATRIIRKLPPQIELGDLINTGVLGLMDALDKYDPDRDIKFETYAEFRIRGAILDELRSQDWVPRSIRQRLNELEKAFETLQARLGRPATDEEVAAEMGINGDELFDLIGHANGVTLVSLDDLGKSGQQGGDRRSFLDYLKDPYQESIINLLNLGEMKAVVAEAIENLPKNERRVISMYYFDELTMKEIGEVLSVTESRVSQIHNSSILRLKGRLRQYLNEDK